MQDVEVVCSCNRKSTIVQLHHISKFYSRTKDWKYRTTSEADAYQSAPSTYIKVGWYCGREHHYQESTHELS